MQQTYINNDEAEGNILPALVPVPRIYNNKKVQNNPIVFYNA